MTGIVGADHDDAEFGVRLGRDAGIRDAVNQVGGLVPGNAEIAGMIGGERLFPYWFSFPFPVVRNGISQEKDAAGVVFICSTCCSYCFLHHWGCSRGSGVRGDGAAVERREASREKASMCKIFIGIYYMNVFQKRHMKVVAFFAVAVCGQLFGRVFPLARFRGVV